jgi:antitoxin (DNA-binding transcriptional repressor) of toxin-antitoxin stability system
MTRLTATEVAREFSSVVSRVGAGEEVEVVRNGVPIVQMRPATSGRQTVSAARWRDLIDSAPDVDDDFERDVEAGRDSIGPPSAAWPS